MNWKIFLSFFAIAIIVKFIINIYKFLRLKNLYEKYNDFIFKGIGQINQYNQEIRVLFKEAGVSDFIVLHQEFMGMGQLANIKLSGLANMSSRREDIVYNLDIKFLEAIGVYRKRVLESFNPVFWIELILKLPQYLFSFLGVLPEKAIVKIALLIYWIACIFFGLNKFNLIEYLLK